MAKPRRLIKNVFRNYKKVAPTKIKEQHKCIFYFFGAHSIDVQKLQTRFKYFVNLDKLYDDSLDLNVFQMILYNRDFNCIVEV